MRLGFSLSLLLALTILLGACTGVTPTAPGNMGGGMQTMDQATAMPVEQGDGQDMVQATTMPMEHGDMQNMDHGSMQMNASQPFDAQFIDSMIEHHLGAVAMAEEALQQSEREEIRAMATAIIAAQNSEIEQMRAWRAAWYPDLPATGGMGMSMGEMGISADATLPFDQRFLTAMISHHQGAIEMAQMAQQMAEHQEIKDLADAIITAQQAEIEQMNGWLQAWFQ